MHPVFTNSYKVVRGIPGVCKPRTQSVESFDGFWVLLDLPANLQPNDVPVGLNGASCGLHVHGGGLASNSMTQVFEGNRVGNAIVKSLEDRLKQRLAS